MNMEKFVRDGKVAILYSPGHGSGWYTWNTEYPELMFDRRAVAWALADRPKDEKEELEVYLEGRYPDIYIGSNIETLVVCWVPEGQLFRIVEHDGHETVMYPELDNINWHTA